MRCASGRVSVGCISEVCLERVVPRASLRGAALECTLKCFSNGFTEVHLWSVSVGGLFLDCTSDTVLPLSRLTNPQRSEALGTLQHLGLLVAHQIAKQTSPANLSRRSKVRIGKAH
jgi:hypothetical protein